MLLDMLTANAATRHGDPSPPPPPPPHGNDDGHGNAANDAAAAAATASSTNSGSFLAQLPLSLLGSYLRRATPSPSPSPSRARAASTNGDDAQDAPDIGSSALDRKAMAHDVHIGAFAPSRPASAGSSAADDRLKKRAPRPKTSFLFAKPVQPSARSKLHLRPKVLLQLHQVIAAQRPRPAYEVIPFSLLPQKSTRRLARSFNTRERLGPHDLLIVEAEAYTTKDDDKRCDEERWESRDVIAVVSKARADKGGLGKAEICMNDGMSRWEVSTMPNGSFEFNTTDDHGLLLKARWVLKPPYLRKSSGLSSGTPLSPTFPAAQHDDKFTFSTISARSRRHPIIATMTRHRIDIMDSYAVPSAASPPVLDLMHSSLDLDTPMGASSSSCLPVDTDDALRRFIVASGIWVAANNYAPIERTNQPKSGATAISRPSTNRTASMSVLDSPRSASPASILEDSCHSVQRLFRSGTGSVRRSKSIEAPTSPVSTKTTTNTSPVVTTRGRRSSSDANIRSMTGSTRKRHGLAFEDQALPESEEERQEKRSMELLRIRGLALPTPIERPSMETSSVETVARKVLSSTMSPETDGPTSPVTPISSPLHSPTLLSPNYPDQERATKSQSTYNPIKTAGLWDSGVSEGVGIRSRPTSMLVSNERKRKHGKNKRSKSENNRKQSNTTDDVEDDESLGPKGKGSGCRNKLKAHLKNLFRREKG